MFRPNNLKVIENKPSDPPTPGEDEVPSLPKGDPITETFRRGRQEWDERIGDAVSEKRAWRRCCLAAIGALTLSAAGNVYQGTQVKFVAMASIRDRNGDLLDVRRIERSDAPSDAQIRHDLRKWVEAVRTVDVSIGAMKKNI